ncbi:MULTISPECIES: S41 family peptidase [unclassified Streptomyces]|uniref:S41 family peptidase n=1 Tax=unclassified Streptomyces TaxID=2593676 RepID=UPI00381A8396
MPSDATTSTFPANIATDAQMTPARIVSAALERIVAGYVFPQRAVEIDAAIRNRIAAGEYDEVSGAALCERVTAHLQEVCGDKHLRLLWQDEPRAPEAPDDDGRADFLALMRAENQGIRRVEQLDGNIGLLEIRRIADAAIGGRAIGAAMELVAHTRALILDLRECRGGYPSGANLWSSFFFPDDEVHLNDIYERSTDSTRQYWTVAHLPAPRYPEDRPVYVLTSEVTFSGGEDVAYTLQAHGRATVVGETTRGGAHPTARHPVTAHITVTVPTARSINAVTGTNWEGVGVVPDLAAPAGQALEVAHRKALEETESREA